MLKNLKYLIILTASLSTAQHTQIDAVLLAESKLLDLKQTTSVVNNSSKPLDTLFFYNWANAFSHNQTILAERIRSNYDKSFHFANTNLKGFTHITDIFEKGSNQQLDFKFLNDDILAVVLTNPLTSKKSITLDFSYQVKIPSSQFTGFGFNKKDNFNLRFWYIDPIPLGIENKTLLHNIGQQFRKSTLQKFEVNLKTNKDYSLFTSLPYTVDIEKNHKNYKISGRLNFDLQLLIQKENEFNSYIFKDNKVVSNIPSKITEERKFASIRKILDFIKSQGYDCKMHQILIDIGSYKKNKIYGLELQPSIFQPFKDEFIYEVKFLKILAEKIFQEHIAQRPNEKWFYDGLIYKLLIDYVETFYPNQKLIGKYAEMFGINKFRFAQLNFNDRFLLGYLLSARVHLDQSLNNSYEKLSNLNNRIVNPYKAAIGLKFLENYLGKQWIKTRIINHLNDKNQKLTFIDQLIEQAPRNIKWFKEDYLETNKKIDYKISRVLVKEDSISLHIKNLTQSAFPLNIQLHNKNGTIDSLWVDGFKHKIKLRIPNKNTVKIALNNLSYYPELYDKNNWYDLSKKWSKKPFKLRLIKDIKNPAYNEVFYIPSLAFNYYDGLILGVQLNNNGFLKNPFEYNFNPTLGLKSRSFNGRFNLNFSNYYPTSWLYQIQTGISGSSFSYNDFYRYFTLQPYIKFTFNKEDKRSQKNSFINLRYIAVDKEIPFGEEKSPQDQYKLFAAQYQYNEPNIINRFRSKIGVELANSFQKIYTDIQFRKLTYSKRYFEVRLFGGFFLTNQNSNDSNYFNFGLNTTNDYLFEHAILARSNNDGFISQQFINTEGGFKSNSFKDNAFANQWMGTLNTSFSLLSRIELYNNVGFSKSKNEPVFFGYESGLRLNLAENILEFYFPLYNNYGWEFEQGPYSEKIRFVLQFNPQKLLQIFRRGWF